MKLIIFFTSLIICLETINYGIYEFKNYKNKFGGSSIIAISIFMLIFLSIIIFIK